MENIDLLVNAIGSLGFPIVCCWFLWKYINGTMKEFSEMLHSNNENITRLCDKIDMLITAEIGKKGGDDNEQ